VLIGVKEQCDLYPNILSLLADESGISVHTTENIEPIIPAINISNINSFIEDLIIFLIAIEGRYKIQLF
jgi:hypothetical protein